jgi:hypothetical protein
VSVIRDFSRRAGVSAEAGLDLRELGERGPAGEPVLRNTLVDGQTGAGSGMPNERSDGQLGGVPLRAIRWMVWYERFVELPSTDLDRWTVIGPCEIHGTQGATQATIMPEVGPGNVPGRRRRLNANAGRPQARYFDIGPIEIGRWYACKMGVFYANDNSGWLDFWRDGERKVRIQGEPMTIENGPGYFKAANYRNAQIKGRCVYDFSSGRVHDTDPGRFLLPNGGPPPPPEGEPPKIEVTAPLPDAILDPDEDIVAEFTVSDDQSVRTAWIGRVASDGNKFATLTDPGSGSLISVTLPAPPAGDEEVHFYAAAADASGESATPAAYPLKVLKAEPAPSDPCAGVKVRLDAALAQIAAAQAALGGTPGPG